MKSIFKYDFTDAKTIKGPITRILQAGEQHNRAVVWAEIDTDMPECEYEIIPVPTGESISTIVDDYTYLNTITFFNDNLVFHVYYRRLVSTNNSKKENKRIVNGKSAKEVTLTSNQTAINPEILKSFLF